MGAAQGVRESQLGKLQIAVSQSPELFNPPKSVPVYRRDGKDIAAIQLVILQERERLNAKYAQDGNLSPRKVKAVDEELAVFVTAVWKSYNAIMSLQVEESVVAQHKLNFDPDHWYEINLANVMLFDNLTLEGLPEVLPGRLFSTRMPRDLKTNPKMGPKFIEKVRANNLGVVLILTESKEYEKYAGADLEEFYRSIPLEIIHRPIPDFTVPNQPDMIQNIKDLTWRLAEGKNCLVHCAGGSGRTGMVIAGIVKNVGVKDPVAWVRRVKAMYVETVDQEKFVKTIPPVLDERIAKKYPILAKAIAASQMIDLFLRDGKLNTADSHVDSSQIETVATDFGYAFDLIDEDKSGFINSGELFNLFKSLGSNITEDNIKTVLKADDDGQISKVEFMRLMATTNVKVAH